MEETRRHAKYRISSAGSFYDVTLIPNKNLLRHTRDDIGKRRSLDIERFNFRPTHCWTKDPTAMRAVNTLCYYSVWFIAVASIEGIDGFAVQLAPRNEFSSYLQSRIRLYSSPQQRQPRRNLQKRQRKNRRLLDSPPSYFVDGGNYGSTGHNRSPDDFPWETAESRSLITSAAREAGEDYWIDLEELKREQERVERKRLREPGQIPDQKLWTEVLSPYRQNWIGLISVSIIAFAFIFKYFPEVINPPVIANIPEVL